MMNFQENLSKIRIGVRLGGEYWLEWTFRTLFEADKPKKAQITLN